MSETVAPPALAVTRLTLTDFRCYDRLRIDVDRRPVVLTGANGAGKTNLLEAVSFLVPGRGLRRARLDEVPRRVGAAAPAPVWAVAGRIEGPDGTVEVGTGCDGTVPGSERRQVRIDGAPARSQAELVQVLCAVWLTPQMDRLFQEGASARRRFLDRLVYGMDPAHAGRVSAYEKAMRERARLLRDGPADGGWLAALESTMAERGVAVAAARLDMTERLDAVCRGDDPRFVGGPFPKARLSLEGEVERRLSRDPALAVEDWLRAELARNRNRDAAAGGAVAGPHRTDLAVTHEGKGMPAGLCSTGEQKALLIAIVLAEARLRALERGAPPVLLLDEVAAHLDAERRRALFAAILDLGAQAWMTGTDAALFAELTGRASFLTVRDARIVAQ